MPGAAEEIAGSPYCETFPESRKGKWREFFGTKGDLYLETGCGKGRFLAELAAKHPERCYLGIEKYSSVLVRAVRKQEELELPNLRFVRMEAEILPEVFAPGEVAHIYLNFSDPWPKERHASRRLTSVDFLRRYEQILAPGGMVEFKTDNTELFDFSLEELSKAGWTALEVSRDLHADPRLSADNVMTEYEEKFSSRGNKICYLLMKGRD